MAVRRRHPRRGNVTLAYGRLPGGAATSPYECEGARWGLKCPPSTLADGFPVC